ncbi:MAG TPA: DoxX family protein [Gemmatimonadaceae bacterium]|nr:DoxX family protein [Gemmatimonadaceae bacterium]
MTSIAISTQPSKSAVWTSRILYGIAMLFMTFDAVLHVANPALVQQASVPLGIPAGIMPTVGVIELVIVALLLIPRTAFIGALFLTAYLGGATAIQVRAGMPAFQVVFPAIVATLVWAGLALRRDDIRRLIVR